MLLENFAMGLSFAVESLLDKTLTASVVSTVGIASGTFVQSSYLDLRVSMLPNYAARLSWPAPAQPIANHLVQYREAPSLAQLTALEVGMPE